MPDGGDWDKFEGTINIYPDNNEQAADIENIMSDFMARTRETFTIQGPRKENHVSQDQIRVMRYDVVENKTSEFQRPPEMHLSNANTVQLMKLLKLFGLKQNETNKDYYDQYGKDLPEEIIDRVIDMSNESEDDDYYGDINIDELKKVLDRIESNPKKVERYTRETNIEEKNGKPFVYNFGLDQDTLWMYLNILNEMINYAKQNGYREISYG
jgi:hypothetical protein